MDEPDFWKDNPETLKRLMALLNPTMQLLANALITHGIDEVHLELNVFRKGRHVNGFSKRLKKPRRD